MVALLLRSGIPLTPVMVFLLTSPLISPPELLVTAAGLGTDFAVSKLVAALVVGVFGGVVTELLVRRGFLVDQVRKAVLEGGDAANLSPTADRTLRDWMTIFAGNVWQNTAFIGKYVLLAIAVQVVMMRYIPEAWVIDTLGSENHASVPLAAAVGMPLYVNGLAAVPLVRGLLDLGMDPGAALAFLISGPVAAVPSIVAVIAMLERRTVAVFLAIGLVSAVVLGYAFQLMVAAGMIALPG